MTVNVYGYREGFLFCPLVKVYQDGRHLGDVKAKRVLVLTDIAENSVLTFKCGIRKTECAVSDKNIVLSFNRMTGCLEALATSHVDQAMMLASSKDNTNVIAAIALILVLAAAALVLALCL